MISYDLSSCVLLGRTERAAFQRSRILLPSIERLQCCPSLTMNWPPVERQNNANKTAHPKEPSIQKKDNHAFASDRRIEHRFWSRGHGPLRPEKSKVSKVNVMFSLSLSLSLRSRALESLLRALLRSQRSRVKGQGFSFSLSLSLWVLVVDKVRVATQPSNLSMSYHLTGRAKVERNKEIPSVGRSCLETALRCHLPNGLSHSPEVPFNQIRQRSAGSQE